MHFSPRYLGEPTNNDDNSKYGTLGTKRVYQSAGETFAELMSLTKVDKKYIDKSAQGFRVKNTRTTCHNNWGIIFSFFRKNRDFA